MLPILDPLDYPVLPSKINGSRPVDFPDAEMMNIEIVGGGVWLDGSGRRRSEPQLVDLSMALDPYGPTGTLSVHHDIWGPFDFSGQHHPDVQSRNAPRLSNALSDPTSVLGMPPEPGEPTYFGVATESGIAAPEVDEQGFGPDLTD
ncbi:hypothetical protein [Streptomyces sp. NPDC006274]|uniref:hypothetical protein n=1 Tax=unclassified Streptomyces TaxID=2593676 RepID=UPI0033A820FF